MPEGSSPTIRSPTVTWTPPAQADWVHRANEGLDPDHLPSPEPFDATVLMAGAQERFGAATDWQSRDWAEPLSVFCQALETEANLTPLGRWATQRYLRRLIDGRLRLDQLHSETPGAEDTGQAIRAPIFVIGPPRSGTTVTHRLLAADPDLRAPLGWEFLLPLPQLLQPDQPLNHGLGPTAESVDPRIVDPRIAAATPELVFPQTVAQGLAAIHTYSATMVKECLSAQAFSFRTEEFISRYNVPSYVDWLQGCDLTPAYDSHHHVLQLLQGSEPTRWVLKSPVHLQGLPELMAQYPDATIVCTHREPTQVLASVSSLIANLRSAFSTSVDAEAIGRHHLDLYATSLNQLVDHIDTGVLASSKVVHVDHKRLVADRLGAIASVYNQLGRALPDAVRAAAKAEGTSERQDKLGAHQYAGSDFDIDATAAARFDRYRNRFLNDSRH